MLRCWKILNFIEMNFHNLRVVATYNARLLFRSWTFRLFLLLVFCVVIFYQLLAQTDVLVGMNTGLVSLASYIPHQNAYLFSILQVVPLVFLAGTFLGKERKVDSMDTVYYRPESNAEYIVGVSLGFIIVFTLMAGISLLGGMLLHLFASDSPFDIWIYLFYWVTMIFPGLVFALGFSFFIYTWLRHRGLSILILLVVFGLFMFKLSDVRQGLFDPFGLSLPNAFSEITGHTDMRAYLIQRVCWLFIGCGFIGLTISGFRRLANLPKNRMRMMVVSVAFLFVGVVFGGIVFTMQVKDMAARRLYADIYNKYREAPKGNVITNNINFEQKGESLSAKSTLVIRNQGKDVLPKIILYLNPALEVLSVKEGEEILSFEREVQVVQVAKSLLPGEEVELSVEYRGGIDDRVCYLDVEKDKVLELKPVPNHSCVAGKRFALLDDTFTVLTPECLWYPIAQPPVNPAVPYHVSPDFTRYILQVLPRDERMIVAPGARDMVGDYVRFTSEVPLAGMALCMGNFDKRSVVVDSVSYELYLLEGHENLLRGLEDVRDSIPGIIRDARYNVEFKLGVDYPYTRLVLVETPVAFSGFSRPNKGGSEMAQPGLLFFPERGVGFWSDLKAGVAYDTKRYGSRFSSDDTPEEKLCRSLTGSLSSIFTNDYNFSVNPVQMLYYTLFSHPGIFGLSASTNGNLYSISPMFYEQTITFHSPDYPAINIILMDALKNVREFAMSFSDEEVEKHFVGRNMEDVLDDREMGTFDAAVILHEKSREFLRFLSVNDITTEQVQEFLKKYIQDHRFQQIAFRDVNEAFIREFGVDWMTILPTWYTNRQLPCFLVKDFKVESVVRSEDGEDGFSEYDFIGVVEMRDNARRRSRVSVSVFNDSDVDGIVSFVASNVFTSTQSRQNRRSDETTTTRNFLIKAHSGQQIVAVMDGFTATMSTNISKNLPTRFYQERVVAAKTQDSTEYVRELARSYFLPAPEEIVVDNEDHDFQLIKPSSRKRLRDIFSSSEERKYEFGSNVTIRDGVEVVPRHMISSGAYGLNRLTHAFMMQGSGVSMEWKTRIVREGEYDIYAYLPPKVQTFRMTEDSEVRGMYTYSMKEEAEQLEVKQYYIVDCEEEKREVSINIEEQTGWLLLGRFHLPAGECKVVLTDQGNEDQVLLGDAIKWVPVGK